MRGWKLWVVRCERARRRKNRSQKVTNMNFLQKGNKGNEGLRQKDRLQQQWFFLALFTSAKISLRFLCDLL
jgi:hypothetical protein